jgi:L-iditol 2-dehydrogenase
MDVITTTAAEYGRGGKISMRDFPIGPPKAGELLVKITACGICPGEVLRWYVDEKAPFVLGHEPVGIIERCGENAGPFGPGERVFIHHHAPCMRCRHCRRKEYVQCHAWRAPELEPGGMSQHAIVRAPAVASDVLPLPDGIDDDSATFIEPLATVVKSMRRAGVRSGDRVLVIGLGVMGLLHVLLARTLEAEAIFGADMDAARRHKALAVGADRAFDGSALSGAVREATDGDGADVVIVCPGSVPALDSAAACVARGGTILVFTPPAPSDPWAMPVNDLFFKDVRVVTSYSAGPDDTKDALALLVSGLPVKQLITHRLGLVDVNLAYDLVARAGETLKVIVYPNKS